MLSPRTFGIQESWTKRNGAVPPSPHLDSSCQDVFHDCLNLEGRKGVEKFYASPAREKGRVDRNFHSGMVERGDIFERQGHGEESY